MGIQDRDWYIRHLRRTAGYRENGEFRKSESHDDRDAPQQRPRRPQQTRDRVIGHDGATPKTPSAHWTIRLMVWLALLTIGVAIARHFR